MVLWLTSIAVILAVVIGGNAIHPAYVVYRPGPIFNTISDTDTGPRRIQVDGAKTYPAKGELNFTTVSLYGGPGHNLDLWSYLRAKLDSNAEVVPYADVYPDQVTDEQVEAVNKAEMTGAQEDAKAVALRATGRTVPEHAVVGYVEPKGPSAGKLKDSDEIRAVNGTVVNRAADVSRLIQQYAAPTPHQVTLTVRRRGKDTPVTVGTTLVRQRRVVGVALASRFDFPVKITVDAGDVGGPSAGMIFALAIYDTLTPGDLTGGVNIAGTGTIDSEGQVGPIGGIRLKMLGARAGGASWFLAPTSDCDEVKGHIPEGLSVVSVDSFTKAKDAVTAIAAGKGSALPGCG